MILVICIFKSLSKNKRLYVNFHTFQYNMRVSCVYSCKIVSWLDCLSRLRKIFIAKNGCPTSERAVFYSKLIHVKEARNGPPCTDQSLSEANPIHDHAVSPSG